MSVYLDFNATTPIDSEVQEHIKIVMKDAWANPSSSHYAGEEANKVIQNARLAISNMISSNVQRYKHEIFFTSGGTESNNMVIQSIVKHYEEKVKNTNSEPIPHIITTNIEHDSIKLPLEVLEKEGKVNVSFVPVQKTGIVNVGDIMMEIRPNTILITVMMANNETGRIQPVKLIKKYLDRHCSMYNRRIYLHTDAAQAIGKMEVHVEDLGVDYLTIAGHKFYGPRVGALYVKSCRPLYPLLYGGGQELSFRPGTENTCMIAGLGTAALLVKKNLQKYKKHMLDMRIYLKEALRQEFPHKVVFNFEEDDNKKLVNTLSVAFDTEDDITGHKLLEATNQGIFAVFASTGAACHQSIKPSAILIASGVSKELASKTLRLSVGRETTKNDIDSAVKSLKSALFRLERAF